MTNKGAMPYISVEHVTYIYPNTGLNMGRPPLQDFSLTIEEGEFLLVTGFSGAGKSTFLRLLNGLVPHFYGGVLKGRVRVAGLDPVALGPAAMSSKVGFVFQSPETQAVAEMVEDEMAFGMENAGLSLPTMRKRVEESLHALGIEHLRARRISTLSGGEKQRVAIAAVLTLQPSVLVLDEPTSQLDPQSAEEVLDTLVKLNKDLGLTIILSEHRLERVVQYADRILYMAHGEPPDLGEPREVLARTPLRPPLAEVGKLLGWQPLPLTIKEARRFTSVLTLNSTQGGMPLTVEQPTTVGEGSITLENVWYSYPGREVLHGFNLKIAAGRITAIMGRNGAGKSTILKLMLGLLKPSRGSVHTLGLDTWHTPLETVAGSVGYVPQQPDVLLFADSVGAEVLFTRRTHHLSAEMQPLLDGLGLAPYVNSDPLDLSVGERQRVALAAVLAAEPQALVLDEPTRGLDYEQKRVLVGILRKLRDEGRTVVIATHDVELAAHIADRVVLLGDGEVIAEGPTRQVMSGSLVFSSQVGKLFQEPEFITVEDVQACITPGETDPSMLAVSAAVALTYHRMGSRTSDADHANPNA